MERSTSEPGQRDTAGLLAAYGLPEHAPVAGLQALTRVAATLCGVPTATINLLGHALQHQVATTGFTGSPSAISDSLCARAVATPRLHHVPDAREEPALADSPWVDGRTASVRFYASAPLRLPDGQVLGTLCAFDEEPGRLDERQRAALQDLADQAVRLVEQAAEARRAATQAELFRVLAESPSDVLSRHLPDGTTLWVSPSLRTVLGRDPVAEIGRRCTDDVHDEDRDRLADALAVVGAGGSEAVTVRNRHADGSWRWTEVQLSPLPIDGEAGSQVHAVARDVTARVEAEQALERTALALEAAHRDAERRGALLAAVLDTIDVGVVACDADGHLTLFNRASREFHGLAEDASLDPTEWSRHYDLYAADGRTPLEPDAVPLFRALVDGEVADSRLVIAKSGSEPLTARCDGRAMRDDDGRLLGAVVAMKDITRSERAVQALRSSEQRFRAAFLDGPTPMATLDADGVVADANAAARRWLSLPSSRLLGQPLLSVVHPADHERVSAALAGDGTGTEPVEIRVVRPDGQAVWCELACSRSADVDGAVRLLVQLADVQARKLSEEALQRAAHRDALTGLVNRAGLDERLERLLVPGASSVPVSLLFVDLDRFKGVNDSSGHEAGDAVLRETAARLRRAARAGDCVARVGGDEFVVVVTGTEAPVAAESLSRRLSALLVEPVEHAGVSHRVGASIGVAHAGAGGAADVMARADAAMYAAKRARTAVPVQR